MASNAAITKVHERDLDRAVTTVFSRTKDLKTGNCYFKNFNITICHFLKKFHKHFFIRYFN